MAAISSQNKNLVALRVAREDRLPVLRDQDRAAPAVGDIDISQLSM